MDDFQHLLSRLMSLLVSYMMRDISHLELSRFPHLDLEALALDSIGYPEVPLVDHREVINLQGFRGRDV